MTVVSNSVTNSMQRNSDLDSPSDRLSLTNKVERYNWHFSGKQYQVVYETRGQGKPILLLPALSTVSSRTEMKAIANILATQYEVTVLDWLEL
jgi:hypothetical protein